jgi:hypothetical protein
MHSRRSQPPTHSAAGRRCTQHTAEVQRRQLRHPSEARCQRRCSIISEAIACTHRRPSARPSQNPTTRHSLARNRPSPQHQHHQRTAGVRKHPLTAQLATDARSIPLRHSEVSCVILRRLGASNAASAARISLPARPAASRLAPHKPPPSATALRAPASAHSTQHHQRIAGVRKHPLTAQLPADARSIPPRSSDVSCVILPRLGASDAAPAALTQLSARTAAPRLAPRKPPPTHYSPERTRLSPQHATSSMHGRRSQAPAQSAAATDACSVPLRSSDVSCVIPPRLGASDAAPASKIRLSARTAAPRLAPRITPPTRYSPAPNRPSPQHATSSMRSRRSQPPAHSPAAADARSLLPRPSDVSCVIFPRLGASDAAPAASM